MFEQHSQQARFAGRWGVGPGIASYTGWVVAFALVLLLAWLAWWTMRPAKRVARSKRTEVARERDLARPSDAHGHNLPRANQTRKTR